MEIAWDLDYRGGSADKDFIHNYLKTSYAGDNADDPYVNGVAGTAFAGLSFTYGLSGSPYPEDYPDYFNAVDGGQAILNYDNDRIAGVAYSGPFSGTSNGYVVTLGFPLETVDDLQQQINLVNRVVDFFNSPVNIVEEPTHLPETLAITRAFPNPFNGTVRLELQIPENAPSATLTIYDLAGRVVFVKALSPMPRTRQIRWQGRTNQGALVASGFYLARLTTGNQSSRVKLQLIK